MREQSVIAVKLRLRWWLIALSIILLLAGWWWLMRPGTFRVVTRVVLVGDRLGLQSQVADGRSRACFTGSIFTKRDPP